MAHSLTIKDNYRESQLFNRRALATAFVILLLVIILVARLVHLQILSHEHYTTLSHNNRVKITPMPPRRGLIYDRNGLLLAENIPSFSLELIPEQISDMDATLDALQEIITISERDLSSFRKLLKQKRRFENIPLRFRLNEEEVARFAVNQHLFDGVEVQARPIRHYPFDELTAHVIGYVGRLDVNELNRVDSANYSATSHIGKLGVEKAYEDTLHGTVGYNHVEANAQGRTLRILARTPPQPGHDLKLNLDIRLQQMANEALGDRKGSIVAIDPNSGAILAMVSKPSYDPNLFVNGIDPKAYGSLRDSKAKPLFNRALRGQYPPGSTVKPFIGLAGLEHGYNHRHSVFCPGWFSLQGDDHRYRDWKKTGHGTTNLDKAITESCDVYFYQLATELRIDKIHNFMKRFGFGDKTGIDIQGELSGLFPSREWKRRMRNQPWYPGETVITGIGQGFTLTTPLQLASATATLAMHGLRYQPRLIDTIKDVSDDETIRLKSVVLSNPQNWDTVIESMINVVHGERGTARKLAVKSKYVIAGKTGTAQVFGIAQDEEYDEENIAKKLRDHSLFVSFAPAENPRIAVAVVAENSGSGSAVAAPIARKIMDGYLLENKQ